MIELERHIEILLLRNDCVIVPELGGFMAHRIEAHYEEEDGMFLPPLRTLGFNPQLKINDSLLVQSYIEAYDISYPEALQRITNEVNELKMHLSNDGSYELNDIGLLALNDDGNYVFTPCEAGILTPALYGLGSFEMQRQQAGQAVGPARKSDLADTVRQAVDTDDETPGAMIVGIDTPAKDLGAQETNADEADDVVRIKFSWIRNAVAVAAILTAIFILALPTGKTEMMTRTISNINNGLLFGMMSEDTNASKIEIKKIDMEKTPVKVDTLLKKDTATVVPEAAEPEKTGYCIVLASCITQRNAKAFVEQLQAKGYDRPEVYIHNNITRVVYGNFKTQAEAYDTLRRIHRDRELTEAWVYKFN